MSFVFLKPTHTHCVDDNCILSGRRWTIKSNSFHWQILTNLSQRRPISLFCVRCDHCYSGLIYVVKSLYCTNKLSSMQMQPAINVDANIANQRLVIDRRLCDFVHMFDTVIYTVVEHSQFLICVLSFGLYEHIVDGYNNNVFVLLTLPCHFVLWLLCCLLVRSVCFRSCIECFCVVFERHAFGVNCLRLGYVHEGGIIRNMKSAVN